MVGWTLWVEVIGLWGGSRMAMLLGGMVSELLGFRRELLRIACAVTMWVELVARGCWMAKEPPRRQRICRHVILEDLENKGMDPTDNVIVIVS